MKKRNVMNKNVNNSSKLILEKLSSLNKKIDNIQRSQIELASKVSMQNKKEDSIINKENKIESDVASIKKDEKDIEKVLFSLGAISLKKKHALELIRAGAGAFLGVGLGKSLLDLSKLSASLPWLNVMGIFFFVFAISFLLVYKNKRLEANEKGMKVVWMNLFAMYIVSLIIEIFAIILFGGFNSSPEIIAKTIIIGSYSAMAGAVSFSLM